MTLTPIIEASLSFALSVWFAQEQGATGVAMAKVVSGTVGVLLVVIQHPLREALGDMSRRMLVVNGVLRPMAPVPVVLFVAVCLRAIGLHESLAGLVVISLSTILAVWFLALQKEDRVQAISILTRRPHVRMLASGTRP
jgi:cobalamin synthase